MLRGPSPYAELLKISIEICLAKNLNNNGSREVLELVAKHVDYYEDIVKRSIHIELNFAMSAKFKEIQKIVESKDFGYSTDVQENLKQKVESFTRWLKKMEMRCVEGLYNSFCDEEEEEVEEEEDNGDTKVIGVPEVYEQLKNEVMSLPIVSEDDEEDDVTSKVIGVSEAYAQIKQKVMSRHAVTSLVGMPGIGKTTLAKKVFHDPATVERFDHRVWVRVGRNCGVRDIPRRILAEMDPDTLRTLPEGDAEAIHECLKTRLNSKRYLIVLDDVWDPYMAYYLDPNCSSYRTYHLLHDMSESRILLTSRLQQVRNFRSPNVIMMRLLKEKESWDLFCEKVFSGGRCPPQLVKAGKKISENCEGLPLTILAVARLLSEEKKCTPEYWNEVAEKENHQLFKEAYEEISKVLLPSYTYLPPLLQICFCYIGLFRQKYKIPRTKLINLWLADGFDELNMHLYLHVYATEYLMELINNNLVVVYQEAISGRALKVKTCGLHSSLWHLSNKKARESKFALVLRSRDDGLGDAIKGQRRLSFHNNVLFSIKDVYQSVEDNCASSTRSILCFGPYHQYQVPICFGLKLLKELDALTIRFYEFPLEVAQLVQLRYLALTSNGTIPASISQLSKLQFFIVDQHQSIKSRKDPSYLPAEIWGMKELMHIQATGSDLPEPCGASLEKLWTLLNVSVHSCTEAVLHAIPNLRKLRVIIELTPDDDGKTLSCLNHVAQRENLDILKCIIINPIGVPPVVPLVDFLSCRLNKLTLSGLGYPWKEISKIGSIPCLRGLKLKMNAFQGPEWNVEKEDFKYLNFLVIEDHSDLVRLKVGDGAFRPLQLLYVRHCYKFEKFQATNYIWDSYIRIELIDCPTLAENLKMNIHKDLVDRVLKVHSSRDD